MGIPMKNKFNFKIYEKNVYTVQQSQINCVKQDQRTELIGFGTGDGILRIAAFKENDTQVFSKNICTSSLNTIGWLSNGLVCMSTDSPKIFLYDPVKDSISPLNPYENSNTRGVRCISETEIMAWYRDGTTILIDLRSRFKILKLPKRNPVTCANINRQNQNIIYTTNVPGTVLNIWDKRYTSRGEIISSSKQILNTHTTDFEMVNGNLFMTDNLSGLFKVSETGNFKCRLLKQGAHTNFGSLSHNLKFNCLFYGSSNGVYSIADRVVKLLDEQILGCTGTNKNLFIFTREKIKHYKLIPYLTPYER